MQQSMSMLGQEFDAKLYYKDGYLYTDAGSLGKTKMASSEDEAFGQASRLVNFPESAIKDKNSKEVADGTEVSFTVDGSALKDFISDELAQLGADGESVEFGDASIVAVVSKDGTLISEKVQMDFSLSVSGESINASMTMDVTDIAFSNVKIEFPDDLDSYDDLGSLTEE
jgi:hypothetical protein